ncbi:hypothetical protein IAR55_001091 [Kwoniella newhampshirensis]|uniref:Protein SQS1 n=1 Tax=Kwoniella newhampshirensis TaxID=1651941 RepID=A0AAW0Z573_9TREE
MPPRQGFGDFLNSGGPSTLRGRGRGRGGGGGEGGGRGRGGGGGRGGGSFGGGGGAKKSYNADYTNMGFNYEAVNSQRYTKMDGFNVTPFGPSPVPSGISTPRRSDTFHSRGVRGGRGGGGLSRGGHLGTPSASAQEPRTPSGAATPVHGLGYHDPALTSRSKGDHRGLGLGKTSTVGRGIGTGEVRWGGGMAPIFVKAGELFKEGEADVITMTPDHHFHVEALPMDDPSAPQMTDLRDETEIDIRPPQSQARLRESTSPESEPNGMPEEESSPLDLSLDEDDEMDNAVHVDMVQVTEFTEQLTMGTVLEGGSLLEEDGVDEEGIEEVEEQIPGINVDNRPSPVEGAAIEASHVSQADRLSQDIPLFYIDTDPNPYEDPSIPVYETLSTTPLGASGRRSPSDDEQIVFVPKTFRKPEPVSVPIASTSQPLPTPQAPTEITSRAFVNPRALSRAEKKAAKREKRRNRGTNKANKRQDRKAREDSDIEWGSEGPPPIVLGVPGVDEEDDGMAGGSEDMRILRDYMAGTRLNQRAENEERGAEDGESANEEEGEIEVDVEAMRLFGEGIKGLTEDGAEIIDEDEGGDWQSDDTDETEGSSSSSILGELDGIIGDEDDEDTDEEEGEAFSGSNQWRDDTQWFIEVMEDALDNDVDMRDRKSRNKIFRQIEDGDFGDDWGLEPAIKSKRNKHIAPQLQAQWEKDRKAKAEKKQQRELERLIAEIEPYALRKGKGKGKGKNKAHQASVAHLIPASASEVARMFDISSDEDEDGLMRPPFRKGGRMPSGVSLDYVDQKIQIFLDDKGKQTLSLPPMDKEGRKKVHLLAECYGLKSKSRGSGKTRFTVLIKLQRSGTLIDKVRRERLLTAAPQSGGQFYKTLFARGGGGGGKGKGRAPPGPSVRHKDGDLVGEGAEKIGMENIGHKLLSKMGWAEGDRIGRTGGLDAPIVAIVKNTKMGLGA